jgi:DNA polymerase III epsilon subunit-like protein
MNRKYIFIDTETGGLDTNHSLLTMYCGIFDENLNHTGELDLKLKPTSGLYKTSAKALEVNRINLEEHSKSAVTYEEGARQLTQFLDVVSKNGDIKLIPVGHNIAFDLKFIMHYMMDEKEFYKRVGKIAVDTTAIGLYLKCAGIIPMEVPNSLGDYARYFGIQTKNLHDAKVDVILNAQVYKKMMQHTLSERKRVAKI